MHIALWAVQVVLGLLFLLAGIQKVARPLDTLAATMTFVRVVPAPLVRFIGVAEALGGLGLILPALTGILPWLTIWAALGLAVVMVLAAIFHVARREYSGAAITAILLLLAAIVAYGRWQVAPF